jgi:hypothetical protein
MRLCMIGQHIKEEPCAKQRVLLGISSSRFLSVSRGVRLLWGGVGGVPPMRYVYVAPPGADYMLLCYIRTENRDRAGPLSPRGLSRSGRTSLHEPGPLF